MASRLKVNFRILLTGDSKIPCSEESAVNAGRISPLFRSQTAIPGGKGKAVFLPNRGVSHNAHGEV